MLTTPFSRTLIAAALSGAFALPAFAQIDVRFATFNASLNRDSSGQLLSDLANPAGAGTANATARRILQATNVAEIIQRVNPDVLLVNEFDFDFNGVAGSQSTPTPVGYSSNAAVLFQDNFLSKSHETRYVA